MSSDRLAPPNGYTSWLDYAIATMETRELFLEVCWGESPWPEGTQREDMRLAAREELTALRQAVDDRDVLCRWHIDNETPVTEASVDVMEADYLAVIRHWRDYLEELRRVAGRVVKREEP